MNSDLLSSCFFSLVVVACMAARSPAAEEPVAGDLASLRQQIVQAAEPPPDPNLASESARLRLLASIERLERFLAGGGPEGALAWAQWLELPALHEQVNRPESEVAILESIQRRYYQNQAGLELAPFVAVRNDLRGYLIAREYARHEQPYDLFRGRLTELSQCLERLEVEPTSADAQQAGRLIAWIEPLSPAGPSIAAAVRARYCRTNALARVSGRFLNHLLSKDVSERSIITDVILGSYTWGPAYSDGHVSFGLVPSQQHATLEVRLRGQTLCPANTAQKGRIVVHSSAHTSLSANKQVFIDDEGLRLLPASASCATSVQVQDVVANSRVLERLAARRVNRLLPQAEQAAARRAEAEASSKLDQQADAALGGVNDMFRRQIRAPLIRFDALPAMFQFQSDEGALRIALSQHSAGQLAAAGEPPPMAAQCDLAFAVHESMIENFCETLLGGHTIEDQQWLELVALLTGSSPRALWVHDRAERWSVTLADERPVTSQFAKDRASFTLRVVKVARGQREYVVPLEIEARFAPESTRDGPALARDGEVAIRFAEPPAPEIAAQLEPFLKAKFGAVFPSNLRFHGLMPPTGGSLGKLRQLQLDEFATNGGWLKLAYRLP